MAIELDIQRAYKVKYCYKSAYVIKLIDVERALNFNNSQILAKIKKANNYF